MTLSRGNTAKKTLWGHSNTTEKAASGTTAGTTRPSIFSRTSITSRPTAASTAKNITTPSQTSNSSLLQQQTTKDQPSGSRRSSITLQQPLPHPLPPSSMAVTMPEVQHPVSIMRAKTPPTATMLSNMVASAQSPIPTTPPRDGPVSIMRAKTPPFQSTNTSSAALSTSTPFTPTPPATKPPLSRTTTTTSATTKAYGARSISTSGPNNSTTTDSGIIGQRRRSGIETTRNPPTIPNQNTLAARSRVAAATAASIKRTSVTGSSAGGSYTSAVELPSGSSMVDAGGGVKRSSVTKRAVTPTGSSSHATVIADLTSEHAGNGSGSDQSDLQTLVTEQAQRIAELESKLKESEKREQEAIKHKNNAIKELETNKKFMFTDIKSVELLKTQLQEEHQTNASLIIFNRSLKTQVAELEGIIENLLQQKGATQLDITAIMAKIDSHKPVMPKVPKQ
ncbi:hypothetical protein BCR33DRAFT_852332 [Rhizoclosmatium globosum]|uniref:Uncharacterized protein n=1 Tax=Rhizoclosmatium globosum TaxID=329046 RepID=A0A1Y2C380_9FUNG|nr:hypothetical protein BCR33DRAFT_852332 [Rhizoclosmatium globosum]|eukprot:ORY41344.1 hypothetical protein BCR33DRAFT_852332 [Rhizoclosmatium globosum]